MTRALEQSWANPSSIHRAGQEARRVVELAREQVAALLGARPRSITFTSGGTESIDLAIRGALAALAPRGRRVIVSSRLEHHAVVDLLEDLQRRGVAQVRWAPIVPLRAGENHPGAGGIDTDALPALLDEQVALVSVQWANNETGVIQPVERVAQACRRARGGSVLFHCDATQWVGKMPTDLGEGPGAAPAIDADLLTCSPHKFHGPKGVGVLWTRRGTPLAPTLRGTQERGQRGGTENVPGIAGAGAAAEAAIAFLADADARRRLGELRDRFEHAVLDACPGAVVNAPRDPARRLWNTTNIAFPRLEAEAILLGLSERGVWASAGAACSSGSLEPSPVLRAMGVPDALAHGSIRFSIGRDTREDDLAAAAGVVAQVVGRLRRALPGS